MQSGWNKKYKITVVSIIVGLVLLVVLQIILSIKSEIYSLKLNIMVFPKDAIILIGDEEYTNGEHDMKPGEYAVQISKDGYNSISETIELHAKEEKFFGRILSSIDGNKEELSEEDEQYVQIISDKLFDAEADEYTRNHPIVEDLPIVADNYKIGSGSCLDSLKGDFCIAIKADVGYRNLAVDDFAKIADVGDYHIEFQWYSNWFEIDREAMYSGDEGGDI